MLFVALPVKYLVQYVVQCGIDLNSNCLSDSGKKKKRYFTLEKREDVTYVDELNLPDLLDQLHGGVAVDEEGLGVVAQLQRLQPLGHRRGVVAVVADGPHLRVAGEGVGKRKRAMKLQGCVFI